MPSTATPRFTWAELAFSSKTFFAAMVAMYLANGAGLPRPFWAMLTVYIVSNPLAGAVRSKSLFRLLGTVLGSVAALLLVPPLSDAPELLTLALGTWTAVCLFVSLLDRTPRSYVFLLAGYTAAVIGFPSVQAPLQIFDTAVARVEEIALAILCATVVHSVVFPTGLGPTLLALLDRTLRNTGEWIADLMAPAPADASAAGLSVDRSRVAGDLTQLRLLSTHIPFDTTHLRWTAGIVGAVQDRVAALAPTLSAVDDRLRGLRAHEGELAPDVVAALAAIAGWLEALAPTVARGGEPAAQDVNEPRSATADGRGTDPAPSPSRGAAARSTGPLGRTPEPSPAAGPEKPLAAVHAAIDALAAGADAPSSTPWGRALRIGLAVRLGELVDGWQECAALRADVDAGLRGRAMRRGTAALGARVLHRDYGIAALSGVAALIAVCVCNTFWIATGWSSGAGAAVMAAVFCSFFATQDDPAPAIYRFLRFTLWSVPLSTVFVLVLLPLVQDFGMLVAVCAPVFLVLGCYVGRPDTTGAAMPIVIGVAGTLALHDTAAADLASFLNSVIAQVVGMLCAALVTALVRSVGADWTARRIRRAIWREIGQMAGASERPDGPGVRAANGAPEAFAVRMLDRIALLAQRAAPDAAGAARVPDDVGAEGLVDLRVGIDIARLQQVGTRFASLPLAPVLLDVARLFRARARRAAPVDADRELPALLPNLDQSLRDALAAPERSSERRSAIAALVGLRRNLFPGASPLEAAAAAAA